MQILIADDDEVSRFILQKTIENLGHICLTAENGEEAWELYEAKGADVLISDWIMPGLSGLELCKKVRGRTTGKVLTTTNDNHFEITSKNYTYFIFLTALSDSSHLLMGIESGADDYLMKPLNIQELTVRLLVAGRITSIHRNMAQKAAELERLNDWLFHQGRKDALTDLHNRLRLAEDLAIIESRVSRYGDLYNAIMLDIDHFKQYNDIYGHLAGDRTLRKTAQVLLSHCRKEDIIYRYGGEEFLVILPHQTTNTSCWVADKLRQVVQAMALEHKGNPPLEVITISAGVAELKKEQDWSVEEWLKAADLALYQAKQAGRNQVMLYHE